MRGLRRAVYGDSETYHPPQEQVERGVGLHVCPACCSRACLCGGRPCPSCGYEGGYQRSLDDRIPDSWDELDAMRGDG